MVPGERLGAEHDGRRQQKASRHTDLRHTAVEAAAVLGCVFHSSQNCTAPLTPDAEALNQSQQYEKNRGPHTDLGGGRKDADQERRCSHQEKCEHQDLLASDAVAEVAHHNTAEWPRQEADREGGEGKNCRQRGVCVRKEQRRKDQRGGGAVDLKVVPLDRGADQNRSGHTPQGRPVDSCGRWGIRVVHVIAPCMECPVSSRTEREARQGDYAVIQGTVKLFSIDRLIS